MTTKTKAPEASTEPEVERIDPTEGYRVAAEVAADEGRGFAPIDQRTGRVVGSSNPTAAQRQAELRAQAAAEEAEVDAFIETIQLAIGDPAPYGGIGKAIDQRKAKDLLRAALERLSAQQDDPARAALAARALQRIDKRDGVVKAGIGLKW